MQKFENNLSHVIDKQLEVYTQRQLIPSIVSHFALTKEKEHLGCMDDGPEKELKLRNQLDEQLMNRRAFLKYYIATLEP